MLLQVVLFCAVVLLSFIYVTGKYNENYWKKRGVKFHNKNKVTGVFWDYLTMNRALFQIVGDLYKQYREEPAVAFGGLLTPSLLVNDATNLQHIFQTDFQSFSHRGFHINEGDRLADNILFMNGNRWKLVRQSMTPVFTGAKLKNMFYIMDKNALDFIDYLKQNPDKYKNNVYDSISKFCCAATGASVFGVVPESIFESPFFAIARKALESTFITDIKTTIVSISPWLSKKLNIKLFSEYEDFFIGAIKRILRQREQDGGKKHDFADICVALQRNGTLRDRETGLEIEPTDELMAAQAFFFFVAGVDPSAAAIFATLVQLGLHPIHLEEVHNEIDATFGALNGKLTYESVVDMKYLDKVLCESLRLLPPIGFVIRQCVEDAVLPVGNIKVEKGTRIYTPIYELHHDAKHYPNPEVFDPERFASESAQDNSVYMPFGKGNRLCVGMRFARLQVKTGLIYLLRHFNVKTKINGDKITFKKDTIQVRPTNVDIEFIPRK